MTQEELDSINPKYIKALLILKPSQRQTTDKWIMTYKGEQKEVFSDHVNFYAESLVDIDKTFDLNEVRHFTIQYTA